MCDEEGTREGRAAVACVQKGELPGLREWESDALVVEDGGMRIYSSE